MQDFTIAERMQISEAAAISLELLALDQTWTSYVSSGTTMPARDLEGLGALTNRMAVLLLQAEQHARYLEHIYSARPDALGRLFKRMMAQDGFRPEDRTAWQELIEDRGGVAGAVLSAMRTISVDAAEERALLAAQMKVLLEGGATPGDLQSKFACGLMVGLAIGLAVGGLWPLAFAAAAGAGAACGRAKDA